MSKGMPAAPAGPGAETLLDLYLTMVRIREVEEKVADLVAKGEIGCPVHLYTGQEAVATGTCANLRKDDWVFSTHRSHGHYLAKGGDLKRLVAELFGKQGGSSRGYGGSMHLAAPDIGLPGSSAIVAGTIPVAVGAAQAFAIRKKKNVSVAFFGDGAVSEGVFYEALNYAGLKKLPAVFVCENNYYSTHMPIGSFLADTAIARRADLFNMPGVSVDGNDVLEVYSAAATAIDRGRRGEGPSLLECRTYRWRGHVGPNYDLEKGLRTKEELDRWIARDPVKNLETVLRARGLLDDAKKTGLMRRTAAEVEEAIDYARQSPYPVPAEAASRVYKT